MGRGGDGRGLEDDRARFASSIVGGLVADASGNSDMTMESYSVAGAIFKVVRRIYREDTKSHS